MKHMISPLIIVTTVLLALQAGCTPADQPTGLESLPGVTVVYYDITGTSVNELRSDLSRKHPVSRDGYGGDAATEWDIRWTWKGYGTDQCDLSTAVVSTFIRVTLPRWVIPKDADSSLVRSWNEYRVCLAEHEKGHVINVIEQSGKIKDAIAASACDTAEAVAQSILNRIRRHDDEYDRETSHGATQGARFPRNAF